jgi:hypothetical protein
LICNSSDYSINNLPAGSTVTWSIPPSAGTVLQLAPNTPSINQLRITNQKWYGVTTTLTASISNPACGTNNIVLTKPIANDNDNSASTPYSYNQEACTFYNVYHPAQSGTITSNSSPVFVYQGCTVYVNVGNLSAYHKTIAFVPTGSSEVSNPIFWYYNGSQLIFQLPYGSGGIPFTFKITGDGACYEKSLLFFTYSNNGRYSFAVAPNPAKENLMITAKENEEYLKESKLMSTKSTLVFTMNVYDINTNTLALAQRSSIGALQHKLNTDRLRTGYYVLQIDDGEIKHTIKFFKE